MGLTGLHIAGYRSIRSIRFPLRQLSVLVGANGVGKTNLYRSLELVRAAATGELALLLAREGGLGSALWAGERRAGEAPRIQFEIHLDEVMDAFPARYSIELGAGDDRSQAVFSLEPQIKSEVFTVRHRGRNVAMLERKGTAAWYRDEAGQRRVVEEPLLASETALAALRGVVPELDAVRHILSNWRFYHGFRTDFDAPLRRPALAITSPLLDADGSNLGAVLATLAHIRQDRVELDTAIADAFPGAKLLVPAPQGEAPFFMVFPDMPKRLFGANELSDGTLQFLALMGALMSYRLPPLIALNEPESSLHPDLLPALARVIGKAAQRTQVWVVTHSHILADALAAETGSIPRQVIRKDGGTWLDGLTQLGTFIE